MRVLGDTCNVLHTTGILPPGLAGLDVAGLGALIGTSRWAEDRVVLVCDGTPPSGGSPRPGPGIRVIYSLEKEADEILERLISDSTAPRELLVVSSDRRVRRAARRRNARDLESDRFLRALLEDRQAHQNQPEPHHRPASLRPGEVKSWENLFEVTGPIDDVGELPVHLEELASNIEPEPRAPAKSKKPESRQPDPASLLPADLLSEAQHLIEEDTQSRSVRQAAGNTEPASSSPSTPPAKSTRQLRSDDGEIPDDLIEEAEQMLRDLDDEDIL